MACLISMTVVVRLSIGLSFTDWPLCKAAEMTIICSAASAASAAAAAAAAGGGTAFAGAGAGACEGDGSFAPADGRCCSCERSKVALAVSIDAVCPYTMAATVRVTAGQEKLRPHPPPDHRRIASENIGARKPGIFAQVFASEESSVASAPPTSRYVAAYPEPCTETVAEARQWQSVAPTAVRAVANAPSARAPSSIPVFKRR